jgi:hypothetical protein
MGLITSGCINQGSSIKMPVMMLNKLRNGSFAHDLFFMAAKVGNRGHNWQQAIANRET